MAGGSHGSSETDANGAATITADAAGEELRNHELQWEPGNGGQGRRDVTVGAGFVPGKGRRNW